jgi:CheY-like chemotaxis protein
LLFSTKTNMTQGITCFLLDDDTDDLEIFELALHEIDSSYKCVTALNGSEAIQKLKGDRSFIPDYIFIDLNMPVMNGKQFLSEVKNLPSIKGIPLVICSTSSTWNDIEETKQLGATHYIIKPSSIPELTAILTDLFNKKDLPFLLSGTGRKQ